MSKAKAINVDNITQDDTIIALMGPTGTGKSTFIDIATIQKGKTVGHSLKSCTSEIRAVRFPHPTTQKPYVLVDTPGFNDTSKSDTEILAMIAGWLEKTYKNEVKLAGIIYLHRISDNRMSGSPLQNLHMFSKLCGNGATRHVILATTMWSRVQLEVGAKRERELKDNYWQSMIKAGSQDMRFRDSFHSAWEIIDRAQVGGLGGTGESNYTLLLQEELVDLNRRLSETEAGKTLYTKLQKLLDEQKETIRKLRDEAKEEENPQLAEELKKQYQELEDSLQLTFEQLNKMKISLGRRLLMLFTFRKPKSRAFQIPA